eukprot:14110151-Ditylum_brightwellii.AAC.1
MNGFFKAVTISNIRKFDIPDDDKCFEIRGDDESFNGYYERYLWYYIEHDTESIIRPPILSASKDMGVTPSVLLDHCESDCDSDADCSDGLKCFYSSINDALPYCSGEALLNYDYCIDERKLGYRVCSKDDSATC